MSSVIYRDRVWCKKEHVTNFDYSSLKKALAYDPKKCFGKCAICGDDFYAVSSDIQKYDGKNYVFISKTLAADLL